MADFYRADRGVLNVIQILKLTLMQVRADAWIYGIILLYTAFGIALLSLTGNQTRASYDMYIGQWTTLFLFSMPVVSLAIEASFAVYRHGGRQTLAFGQVFSVRRLAKLFSGMALLMGLMVFQGTFTSIKNVLPLLNGGFPHDVLQADIDTWLHLGFEPWRLLHAIAGYGAVRSLVEFNYNFLWFLGCFGGLFFVATSPRAQAVRGRYMAMFMLTWIVCGNIFAGLFLSAGPVFYGAVTGDTGRFADLTDFLNVSEWQHSAASYQRYLWSLHEQGIPGFGSGISAFPSMHVALISFNAFFLAEYSKRLGIVAFAYTSLVALSSVYLGWHYAIDGYAAFALVAVCHFALRRLMTASPSRVPIIAADPLPVPLQDMAA